jgi:hypothetical protein
MLTFVVVFLIAYVLIRCRLLILLLIGAAPLAGGNEEGMAGFSGEGDQKVPGRGNPRQMRLLTPQSQAKLSSMAVGIGNMESGTQAFRR